MTGHVYNRVASISVCSHLCVRSALASEGLLIRKRQTPSLGECMLSASSSGPLGLLTSMTTTVLSLLIRVHGSNLQGVKAALAADSSVKGVETATALPLPRYDAGNGVVDSANRMWMVGGTVRFANNATGTVNEVW
jgi:hypothetical protein